MKINCFKAYDIRGRLPDQLNEEVARRVGRAYAAELKPRKVAVGRDVRQSSKALADALIEGLTAGGADVLDIGLCGTEEVYHATFSEELDGGIMVTASHNPIDYNGMKLVREGSRPISGDSGLGRIQELAETGVFPVVEHSGSVEKRSVREPYIAHLLNYIDAAGVKPLKLVMNAGNGCAGPVVDALEKQLPVEMVKICHEPDGSFPNGIPNPLLPENRSLTRDAVLEHGADLGIAWDGDFDRCFLFDEKGTFIEGYYIVGLLAQAFLMEVPGEKIIHDPRLSWNTIDVVKRAGGIAVQSKTGHAFIKERMRAENAIYGGEMSAHHYFRDFAYCDSGMIPWLKVIALMSQRNLSLSALVSEMMAQYPASGEINRVVKDSTAVIEAVQEHYQPLANGVDFTDGLSLDMGAWRFNLRQSNTEPVIRLNVESRGDQALMEEKTAELLAFVDRMV
jgi:phosphomannomutase